MGRGGPLANEGWKKGRNKREFEGKVGEENEPRIQDDEQQQPGLLNDPLFPF